MPTLSDSSVLSPDAYRNCRLCPRQCGSDRTVSRGFCGCSDRPRAARAALHRWEEPCISGANGSGAVFFSGCTLGCCYCQNYAISHGRFGKELSVRQLADCFLRLQEQGAHNINLVTPTQYLPSIAAALDSVRSRLTVPVVCNCGGYERTEVVRALAGYVDIWLPDFKYFDSRLSLRYSQAEDYFRYASAAIRQMIDQTGPPVPDSRGLLRSGVIIRHMVLPGARQDSIRLLRWMKENLPAGGFYLSLLSQYTPAGAVTAHAPDFAENPGSAEDPDSSENPGSAENPAPAASAHDPAHAPRRPYPELARRVTTFEYESVLDTALDLGLDLGYRQQKSSAKEEFTPPFDLEGL